MLSESSATVSGTLNGDGSLVLDEQLRLPPGRVEVVVRSIQTPAEKGSMWTTLERIWAAQAARDHVPPSREEIISHLDEMRAEWDEHDAFLDRIRNGEPLESPGPDVTETAS